MPAIRGPTWAFAAAWFVLAAAIFGEVLDQDLVSDLDLHAATVLVGIDRGAYPGNFLFYLATAAGAGFTDSASAVKASMVVLLAGAVAAKYLVTAAIADREVPSELRSTWLLAALAAVGLAFSLPTGEIYLGQLPPNVWHNSTTIFLMPFAVALFWLSARYLRDGDRSLLAPMVIVGALNVAVKPSFVFPLLIVFPLAALLRFGLARKLWEPAALSFLLGALVGLQYLYIYKSNSTQVIYDAAGFGVDAKSKVTIEPFHVWGFYSDNIPLSLAASVAFPLVALVVYRRRLWEYDLFRYAGALAVVAFAIWALLAETGVREFHGNFAWQAMVCNYILFAVVLIRVWTLWRQPVAARGRALVALAGAAHVAAGVAFLVYYFANGTYF